MSEVARYDLCEFGSGLVVREGGFVVGSDDYDAALAREAALREELARLKVAAENVIVEGDALQQRLTVAEQRLSQVDGACDLAMRAIDDDERGANFVKIIQAIKDKAALKPAAEVEALGARPVGCCCPPKGHTGIWAAAMCPVHFGLKRPGIKP